MKAPSYVEMVVKVPVDTTAELFAEQLTHGFNLNDGTYTNVSVSILSEDRLRVIGHRAPDCTWIDAAKNGHWPQIVEEEQNGTRSETAQKPRNVP